MPKVNEAIEIVEDLPPSIEDPLWANYVLRHFQPDELDNEGNPYVAGLRRVARKLLGPITYSGCRVVTPPKTTIDGRPDIATVEYTVKFLWCRPEDLAIGQGAYEVIFVDVADVHGGNTDPEYARFPCSTAATRAEGRCLRKALQLPRVVAAEEVTKVPIEVIDPNGSITATQKNFIEILCQRCDINVKKYINSGKGKYGFLDDVPYGTATQMVQHLSSYQNDLSKIPDDIKGYRL